MVAQLMVHLANYDESLYYDPTIVMLTPVEQYVSEVTFSTPTNNKIYHQYRAHCFIAITDSMGIYNMYLNSV
jgi:hypothetical protein